MAFVSPGSFARVGLSSWDSGDGPLETFAINDDVTCYQKPSQSDSIVERYTICDLQAIRREHTVEALDLPQGTTVFFEPSDPGLAVEGYTPDQIAYNLDLLFDEGFLNGQRGMTQFGIAGLTWQGHELLDDIRDPKIWRKTKERTRTVTSVGLNFLWEIAKAEIKTKLGLP